MTNREMTPYVQAISNPNLLDNPWFTVNQRGQSTYIGNSSNFQYTFDRWLMSWAPTGVTITKNSDGTVTFTNNGSANNQQLEQFIEIPERLSNKQVTISVDVVAVTDEVLFGLALSNDPWTFFVEKRFSSTGIQSASGIIGDMSGVGAGGLKVYFSLDAGESITIRAVKLELGSVSTLAMDTAPNYQQELAKCQRYFNIIKSSNNTYKPIGFGYMDETTSARIAIPLSVPMRANPTIVISDLSKFRVYGETARNVSAMSVIDIENNIVHLSATVSSSGTKYSPAILADTTKDEYISFSADLL
jgi:hypothetical protein